MSQAIRRERRAQRRTAAALLRARRTENLAAARGTQAALAVAA